jgi:tRNA pseudouridine38-40 synthase
MMRNIVLCLAYDGTNFVGSQWQPNGRTVQDEVEHAWQRLTREARRFAFSGRTDAGVHAQGQVAHVHTSTSYPIGVIKRALNALLPQDIAVLEAWEAAPEFHARHSAVWRWYRYMIDNNPVALPQLRTHVLHTDHPLHLDAMQRALAALPGWHDFAVFGRGDQSHHATTRRLCHRAECCTVELMTRPLLAVDLVANAFLRHMVRTIIGTLLLVGWKQMEPSEFEEILRNQDRQRIGPTAAAHGLTLMAVGYPEDPEEDPEE